ncbi:ribonuclease domain-containing protein [Xenorhabdus sp. XENO-10]|uniref:Ribonuclease n=1 Tax=Xenorhabdus yunnanensis TaxID=3025878 RepID=A0ABT5LK99_9GAMM|nr:ribonuclease domain-containing protein [Xenorhabdus yunnanensis]MDC9590908.1 ribonuclease domain-containing protein [Xenorhabdus yunnanensis]
MKKGTSVFVVSILVVLLVLAIVYFAFSKRSFVPSVVNTSNISTLNSTGKGTNDKGTNDKGTTKQGAVSPDKSPQDKNTVSLDKPPLQDKGKVFLDKSVQDKNTVSLDKPPLQDKGKVFLDKPPLQDKGKVFLDKPSNQASKNIERLTKYSSVAAYINKRHRLPPFYIQRGKAFQLGWDPKKRNLCEVAPGKAIGGDRYNRRDNKLPQKPNRTWFEANVDYQCGHGSKAKLIYSSDGLVYLTDNQYKSFKKIY